MGRTWKRLGVGEVMYTRRVDLEDEDQTTATTGCRLSWPQGFRSPVALMKLYERGDYTSEPCSTLG